MTTSHDLTRRLLRRLIIEHVPLGTISQVAAHLILLDAERREAANRIDALEAMAGAARKVVRAYSEWHDGPKPRVGSLRRDALRQYIGELEDALDDMNVAGPA